MPLSDHERITCDFFRRVNSAELLRQFFSQFGVWDQMDLASDSDVTEICRRWNCLDCANKADIHEDLCRINDIARESGRKTLYRSAKKCGITDYGNLTVHKLAMTMFLNHREAFDRAYDFFMLTKSDNLYTLLGQTPGPCNPSPTDIIQFRDAISFELTKEAEGPMAQVELEDQQSDKWSVTIPHQHYMKPIVEFDENGEIITRDCRLVTEIILIYYPESGLLKLGVFANGIDIERIAAAFAVHILGKDPDFFSLCEIVNFNPLYDGVCFTPEPDDIFESARPIYIAFNRLSEPGTEYRIYIRDLLHGKTDVLQTLKHDGISISEIDILSLSICFKFPGNKRKPRIVELTRPNRITLDETDLDHHIESVLIRWGLLDHEARRRLASPSTHRQTVLR